MASLSLHEAFELGRHLMAPCRGGRSYESDSKGCALDMAMVAVGAKSRSWTDARDIWPWLSEPSGEFCHDGDDVSRPKSWELKIATKFDCEVMISQSMSMDSFGSWLRDVEERVAPKEREVFPATVAIPLSEVWDD